MVSSKCYKCSLYITIICRNIYNGYCQVINIMLINDRVHKFFDHVACVSNVLYELFSCI